MKAPGLTGMTGALIVMQALQRKPMLVTELCAHVGHLVGKESSMARRWIKPLYDARWVYIHDWSVRYGQAFPIFGWCGPRRAEEDAPKPNARIRMSWDSPLAKSNGPTIRELRELAKRK